MDYNIVPAEIIPGKTIDEDEGNMCWTYKIKVSTKAPNTYEIELAELIGHVRSTTVTLDTPAILTCSLPQISEYFGGIIQTKNAVHLMCYNEKTHEICVTKFYVAFSAKSYRESAYKFVNKYCLYNTQFGFIIYYDISTCEYYMSMFDNIISETVGTPLSLTDLCGFDEGDASMIGLDVYDYSTPGEYLIKLSVDEERQNPYFINYNCKTAKCVGCLQIIGNFEDNTFVTDHLLVLVRGARKHYEIYDRTLTKMYDIPYKNIHEGHYHNNEISTIIDTYIIYKHRKIYNYITGAAVYTMPKNVKNIAYFDISMKLHNRLVITPFIGAYDDDNNVTTKSMPYRIVIDLPEYKTDIAETTRSLCDELGDKT